MKTKSSRANQFPEVITFRIISDCRNDCDYCYGPKNIAHLSFEQMKPIFDTLNSGGARTIVLTGGEPLLHPDFEKLVRYLYSINLKIVLDTSGDNFFRFNHLINTCVSDLGIPLDGHRSSIDYRRPDNFLRRLKILEYYRNFKGQQPYLKIGTVVTRENIDALDKLGQFLSAFPVQKWKLYQFIPIGQKAHESEEALAISNEQFLRKAYQLKSRFDQYFDVVVSPRDQRANAYFLINPNGSVIMPSDDGDYCREEMIGDITDNDIADKWRKKVEVGNYSGNMMKTFPGSSAFTNLIPAHQRLLDTAMKYYSATNSYVRNHIYWLLEHSSNINSLPLRPEVYYPLIILHDIGYYRTYKNPFFAESRLEHMKAGRELSKKLLFRSKLPEHYHREIVELVSTHDNWAFGEEKPYLASPELGYFDDLHFSSSLDPTLFPEISRFYSQNDSETLKRYEPGGSKMKHEFKFAKTRTLHNTLLTELKYQLISSD